jgi:glycolate oxidase
VTPGFAINEQVVLAARRNLSQEAWNYLVGGAESETTIRRNRAAFDHWAFRAPALADVSDVQPSTSLLGQRLRVPVILAPLGYMPFMPAGPIAAAQACREFGTIFTLSCLTDPDIQSAAAGAVGARFFQLYVRGDRAWLRDVIEGAKAAGYVGLVLTVDAPVVSRRDRALLSGSSIPRPGSATAAVRLFQAQATWETLDLIAELARPMPLLLKGIAIAEDAALAVEHGVDVVWVSNHGGRQLDHGIGTLDMLGEIVAAVAGRASIVLDGGICRGSDVVKALALGADAVAIGKLQGWGVAAGGTEGLVRVLEILESEIISTMGLLGVTRVEQLNPSHLAWAEPVTAPHEMSAWVNLPGGRIV